MEVQALTGAVGYDTVGELFIVQPCEEMSRAAELERTDFLQVFAFEEELNCRW
jgi:hypothetical protein